MNALVVDLALTIVKNPYLNYKKHLRLYASLEAFRSSYSAGDIWRTGKFIYTLPILEHTIWIKLQCQPKNTYLLVFNLFWQGGRSLPWLWDTPTTLMRDSPTKLVKYTVCRLYLKKCNYLEKYVWYEKFFQTKFVRCRGGRRRHARIFFLILILVTDIKMFSKHYLHVFFLL